jgi:transcriptional regulator with XRE-family HTH domain
MRAVIQEPSVGGLLREWRARRRLSQLELALDADVSTRHLSFVETGRSQPSRDMVVRLAERLDVPLRERNHLLLAAGYAPAYPETDMDDERMQSVREALRQVLKGHEPYPALVVDRHWELLDANAGVALLLEGVAPEQLAPPVNALRLALHPDGLAPRIRNLGSGARTCSAACAGRCRPAATRSSRRCWPSCAPTRATSPSRASSCPARARSSSRCGSPTARSSCAC